MKRYQATFVNAAGVATAFYDPANGTFMTGDIIGGGMPPVDYTTEQVFDQPGDQIDNVRFGPRILEIPMVFRAEDGDQLRERMRAVTSFLNPVLGDGMLQIVRLADGTGRQVACRYLDGLEGDLETLDYGSAWEDTQPKFRCADPYFYDLEERTLTWKLSGGASWFPWAASPTDFFPHVGASSVFDTKLVENTGDGFAYPIIQFVGPVANPQLINATTNEVIDLSNNGGLTVDSGDVLTIDTRPGVRTVTTADGTNMFKYLTDESSLWAFAVGTNAIQINVGGANEATQATVGYFQRYLHL